MWMVVGVILLFFSMLLLGYPVMGGSRHKVLAISTGLFGIIAGSTILLFIHIFFTSPSFLHFPWE